MTDWKESTCEKVRAVVQAEGTSAKLLGKRVRGRQTWLEHSESAYVRTSQGEGM